MTITINQDFDPQDPQFIWMANGKPIGNTFTVSGDSANINTVWITNTGNSNNLEIDNSGYTTSGGNTITIGTTTTSNTGIVTYPPYTTSPPYSPYAPGAGIPLVGTSPTSPFTFPGMPEQDAQGNKIVRAPQPSLEQILVEIAKILRDGGNILEVRDIFERHKLKLMDHDGEIVFDPKKDAKLEEKNL